VGWRRSKALYEKSPAGSFSRRRIISAKTFAVGRREKSISLFQDSTVVWGAGFEVWRYGEAGKLSGKSSLRDAEAAKQSSGEGTGESSVAYQLFVLGAMHFWFWAHPAFGGLGFPLQSLARIPREIITIPLSRARDNAAGGVAGTSGGCRPHTEGQAAY
jgi:hypothetical protein